MQPTYLPWSGYLNLIARSDVFVLLDDVQFEKQSWQSRNRILLNGRAHQLSVPVRHSGLTTIMRDVAIDYATDWPSAHLRTLEHAYSRAPHGPDVIAAVRPHIEARPPLLVDLTVPIIKSIAGRLGLTAHLERASALGLQGQRSEHIIAICHAVGATTYLSPSGSRTYMEEDRFEDLAGIPIEYQVFDPAPYPQRRTNEFVSHLSILDVIAHLGWEAARTYVGEPAT